MIKVWLAYPLTLGMDIDDPRTIHLRQLYDAAVDADMGDVRHDHPGQG